MRSLGPCLDLYDIASSKTCLATYGISHDTIRQQCPVVVHYKVGTRSRIDTVEGII